MGRGEYSQNLRILSLVNNPESEEMHIRQSTLNALKAENSRLLNILAGTDDRTAMFPLESLRAVELECDKLKKMVDEKNKRLDRLKEV